MNFIDSIINLNSDRATVSERIEAKKCLFGLGEGLEIHKFIYGLFLDGYKPLLAEETEYNNLSKYEFFAGSLTWNRMCKELAAYLNSDLSLNLHKETRKQLQEFIQLLEESHEINQYIDLYRSSQLRLIFLGATGMGMSTANNTLELEPEQLQNLTFLALKKMKSLGVGQKAIFLMGTILHETLLCVERVDDERFKLGYYDSAIFNIFYTTSEEIISQETFWKELYSLKFSAHEYENNVKIRDQFKSMDKQETGERDDHTRLPEQKKSTCHFRCLWAYLKDQLIGKSPLSLDDAYAEWNRFKMTFGQFELQSKHLQNEQLIGFSQKQQKKRSRKQERAISLSSCVNDGRAQETLKLYSVLINEWGGKYRTNYNWKHYHSGCLLKDLVQIEQTFLEMLMSHPISPEDLEPFLKAISNPWVHESFALFTGLWMERRQAFLISLEKELKASESPTLATVKCFTFEILQAADNAITECAESLSISRDPIRWNDVPRTIPGASLHANEVQDLLNLFEGNVERLKFLGQKPCFLNVLTQAVQLGKIEQVERIYKGLSEVDQHMFFNFFSYGDGHLFPRTFPEKMRDYVVENGRESLFAPILSTYCCLQLWFDGEVSDFLRIVNTVSPGSNIFRPIENSIQAASEETILKILSALESFLKEHSSPFSDTILTALEMSLIERGSRDLIIQAGQYDVPGLKPILDGCMLTVLYKEGQFEEIKALGLHKKLLSSWISSDVYFAFDLGNYQEGLNLLQETSSHFLGPILADDLLTLGCGLRSKEIVLTTLRCYEDSPCYRDSELNNHWGILWHERLLFIVETVAASSKQKESPILRNLVIALLMWTQSKEACEQTCKVCDGLEPDLMRSILEKNPCKDLYEYIDVSNPSFLARELGKKMCDFFLPFLKWSIPNSLKKNSVDARDLKQFLIGWQFLLRDFDLSDQKALYQNLVLPLFESEAKMYNSPDVAVNILKELPSAEDFRPLIALVWFEQGLREEALKIFPDEQRLDAMRKSLFSRNI